MDDLTDNPSRLTGPRPRPRRGVLDRVGWRLVLMLVGSMFVLLAFSGWLALRLHRQHLEALLEEQAVGLGETILSSAHSSMLDNDRRHLGSIVENIGRRERVEAIRLVDARGEVTFSSDPREVGAIKQPEDPSCRGCHVGGSFSVPTNPREGLHVIRPKDRGGPLRLAVAVLNLPECSAADCHVHPESQRVLGVLDLELSTAGLEQSIAAARVQMIWLGVGMTIPICAVIGLVSWRFVNRPLRELRDGTRRVAAGDLSYRIPRLSPGEMEELADSFNDMTGRVQSAREELEEWGRTLEKRVADKTAELQRAHDRMVFAEKMVSLGKLAAIVAHEINNPLAGVLVTTKLVSRRLGRLWEGKGETDAGGRKEIEESLAMMERETARCGDIVRNLLLFSRRRELTKAPENLNQILQRSMKLVQHQADLQEVVIDTDLAGDIPEIICDAGQIGQACLAVIMNAIEAMPDGGRLSVKSCHLPERGRARIEITDTGSGIPEEIRNRIFEPFFTTKSEGKGTGLGLSVMYGIVQRHRGRVDYRSAVGRGTTFHIELPIVPPPGPADDGDEEDPMVECQEGDQRA